MCWWETQKSIDVTITWYVVNDRSNCYLFLSEACMSIYKSVFLVFIPWQQGKRVLDLEQELSVTNDIDLFVIYQHLFLHA